MPDPVAKPVHVDIHEFVAYGAGMMPSHTPRTCSATSSGKLAACAQREPSRVSFVRSRPFATSDDFGGALAGIRGKTVLGNRLG